MIYQKQITMTTLKLQTIGGLSKETEISVNQLADYLEESQTGSKKAGAEMIAFSNQELVDKFEIKAIMEIGGEKFLKFNKFDISAVLDEFDTLYPNY